MNVLSLMLNKSAEDGLFGLHPGCESLQLTHLCFADDLLIFVDGSEASLEGVLKVLSDFERISGLAVNISKTIMFCSGIPEDTVLRFSNRFGLSSAKLPVRYLGVPLCSKKLSFGDCDPLLLQIKKKMNSWTTRALSMAGRLTMLTSVISGIIDYWSSAFFLPKKVIRAINSLCSSFLWHGKIGVSSGAKVAWNDLSYPKAEGGLGIRSMEGWSQTCALKLIWMLYFREGSIWVAWIRSKYLSSAPFWSLNVKNYQYSWMFRRLLKMRHKALQFLRIKIGDGDSTFFWWDPWTPFGLLYSFLGQDGPSRLGIPLFATVSDIRNGSSWLLPSPHSDRQLELAIFLTTTRSTSELDLPIWSVSGVQQKLFISKGVWNIIRPRKPVNSWSSLVWHKTTIPRHATTTWLFVLNRNPTLDRLHNWNPDTLTTCLLCGVSDESRDHLFFECQYSCEVWRKVTSKLNLNAPPSNWSSILLWLPQAGADPHVRLALLMGWQSAIYYLWYERNARMHLGITRPSLYVASRCIDTVIDRCHALCSLGSPRGPPLLRIWFPP
ncbi:hypothetical protein Bca101_068067 [Brassica carinata]